MMNSDSSLLSFSPKALMRSWRPERFSDSDVNFGHPLNSSVLEYHLSVLTSHNKETEFERFAKAVAEHAICPNLMPQTGPTGGGDAKVDTETYPVSPQLALAWYMGAPDASTERWAFAFSAKREWKPKAKSDIRKIAVTGRPYVKAFFISNQLISDKDAAAVQDELREELGIDVRVLGQSWLVQEVFSKELEILAIEKLGLNLPTESIRVVGPNDAARKAILESLETSIRDLVQDGNVGADLVNDCIEAARLSRELELSRVEVDGRYERAKRLARQRGSNAQVIIAVYQHAWTTYHWHEDFETFDRLYDELESLTKDSNNAAHLELLNNLWLLAFTVANLNDGSHGQESLGRRTITVATALERVMRIAEMPSSALQARAMLLIQSIVVAIPAVPGNIFEELQDVVRSCGELIGFPFESLVDVIEILDPFLGDLPEFEALHDVLVSTLTARSGQSQAANLNLRRAASRLDVGKPYDAITLIGRSLIGLSQYEHRDTLVSALNLIGHAYESVGLLWAARGALLNSICLIIGEFESRADTSGIRSGPISRMKWLELQLGRLPQSLEWAYFAGASAGAFGDQLTDEERHTEWLHYDSGLGLLCLRADLPQLERLTFFPTVFSKFGFEVARASLLFALGHDDDFSTRIARDGDGPNEVFSLLCGQPIAESIPQTFTCDHDGRVEFFSHLWGCRISVSTLTESPYVELAESILAAAEAILATLGRYRTIAATPRYSITIQPSECEWFECELDTPNAMLVKCGKFESSRQKLEDGQEIQRRITELIIHVFCRAFTGSDILKTVETIVRDEMALDRGSAWISSFVTLANVLGEKPKVKLADFVDGTETNFPLQRTTQWHPNAVQDQKKPSVKTSEADDSEIGPTFSDAHQRDIEVDNLISLSDWDAARWRGAAFSFDTNVLGPPILALVFDETVAAQRIFSHWRSELGVEDVEERLRIVVIRGISRANPHAYRLSISGNPKRSSIASKAKFYSMMSRIQTMESPSPQNLSTFLSLYQRFGKFGLTWANWDGVGAIGNLEPGIFKRDLTVRNAWEIGIGDRDCIAIHEDDDPIIPDEETNPPVSDLLIQIRSRHESK